MPLHPIIPILGPPDYRDWLTLSDSFSDDQKNQQYMRDIMPYISDNTEGTPLNKALQENAWLLEFLGPESDFEAALNELRQRPNEATMILADFVKHLAGTVMAVSWQERMKDVVERFA
jgi:hypothetical protein